MVFASEREKPLFFFNVFRDQTLKNQWFLQWFSDGNLKDIMFFEIICWFSGQIFGISQNPEKSEAILKVVGRN